MSNLSAKVLNAVVLQRASKKKRKKKKDLHHDLQVIFLTSSPRQGFILKNKENMVKVFIFSVTYEMFKLSEFTLSNFYDFLTCLKPSFSEDF